MVILRELLRPEAELTQASALGQRHPTPALHDINDSRGRTWTRKLESTLAACRKLITPDTAFSGW